MSSGSSAGVGRKFHGKYAELKFLSIKLDNGRCAAVCEVCNVTLKNTSVSRLQTHRKRCHRTSDSEPEANYSDDSTSSTYNKNRTLDRTTEHSKQLSRPGNETSNILDLDESLQEQEITEEMVLDPLAVDVCDIVNIDNVEIIDEDTLQDIEVIDVTSGHGFYCLSTENDNPQYNTGKKIPDIFKKKNDPLLRPSSAQSAYARSSFSSLSTVSTTASMSDIVIRNEENRKTGRANKMKRKSNSNKVLNSFVDSMSSDAKETTDMALAKYFYGCNIPFSVVESDHFKNFVKIVRPSYNLPCRKTLSSTLLDQVTTEVINLNGQSIGKQSCLIIDGWKNSSNNTKNVVTMLQTVGGHSLFLECCDFSTEKETGEALADICKQSVEIASSQYKCEIYAVVSDNAANMIKMGRLTTLWHSTCSSHTANLLAKDVLDLDVIKKVNIILKEFKRTDLENLLKENGGWKIVLPAETRWCSHRDACQNFIKNLSIMKKICALENVKIKADITFNLYDDNFLEKVHETIDILNPICELTNKCQGSNFSIADSAEDWINLKKKSIGSSEQVKLAVQHRFSMAVTVYGMAANFFHPLYNGKQLESEQMDLVQDFILDHLDSNGLDGLNAFTNNTDIFSKLLEKKIMSPDTFWGLVERKFPTLSTLALKLLKIPASSAQLERVFSNWSFVHSPLRNRLSFDKSKKLISIYYSLKLKDSNKSDDY